MFLDFWIKMNLKIQHWDKNSTALHNLKQCCHAVPLLPTSFLQSILDGREGCLNTSMPPLLLHSPLLEISLGISWVLCHIGMPLQCTYSISYISLPVIDGVTIANSPQTGTTARKHLDPLVHSYQCQKYTENNLKCFLQVKQVSFLEIYNA